MRFSTLFKKENIQQWWSEVIQDFDLIFYISEQEEERIPISSFEPDQVDPDNPDADDPEMRNESSDEEEVIF